MKKLLVYTTQMMETGGLESHILEFCQNMSGPEIEIFLVVLNSELTPRQIALYKKYCAKVFLGSVANPKLRPFWLLTTGLQLMRYSFDAFYSNGQGNSISLFSKLIRRTGPWVHHHHTAGDTEDQETWTKGYLETLEKADTVIACSTFNAKAMEAVLKRRIDMIPCFSRKLPVHPSRHGDNSPLKLGYYGRLIPEKGIDTICMLSDETQFANIEFHIWGKGEAYPPAFFTKYPKVKYNGAFSTFEELVKVVNGLDGFLLISTHPEGLPISLLEVMSAGVPWLATDRGGIRDIVIDKDSTRMIASDLSYEQIKNAVSAFINDISLGRIKRDAQRKLYNYKFSAEALKTQWCNIFNF